MYQRQALELKQHIIIWVFFWGGTHSFSTFIQVAKA